MIVLWYHLLLFYLSLCIFNFIEFLLVGTWFVLALDFKLFYNFVTSFTYFCVMKIQCLLALRFFTIFYEIHTCHTHTYNTSRYHSHICKKDLKKKYLHIKYTQKQRKKKGGYQRKEKVNKLISLIYASNLFQATLVP